MVIMPIEVVFYTHFQEHPLSLGLDLPLWRVVNLFIGTYHNISDFDLATYCINSTTLHQFIGRTIITPILSVVKIEFVPACL